MSLLEAPVRVRTAHAVVAASGLSRQYGEGDTTVHALRNVSIEIEEARLTAIMGPSGSGKSTLMHILAGLDRPTGGEVFVAGQNITKLDDTAQVDPTTKEQYYEGTVAVSDLKGADGAEVSLKVVADQRSDVLTVPIAAVKQNGAGRDVVRVIDLADKGKVREVAVTTGLSEDSYIEIRKGLDGGEVVVVEVDKKS